jgi:dipeptidyl aminopeptidase/acylaminoacyl peptidase
MATAPYGSWRSPISSELITKSTIRLDSLQTSGDDVFWLESRPLEGGRYVIVSCRPDGSLYDLTPQGFNVRSLVHEYGGRAYTIHQGTVYFVNYEDQRIYTHKMGESPKPLTAPSKIRFADLIVDATRNRLVCVQEDHSEPKQEALTSLASISLVDGNVEMIIAGNDFYSDPRFSPNGMFMSWTSWNHPNMPWDDSSIWAANVGRDGSLTNMRKVAGETGESVQQPQWSPDGELFYISDRSGWWNLYKHTDYEGEQTIAPREAEFGRPQWTFGQSTYAFISAGRILCTYCCEGVWKLAIIDAEKGSLTDCSLEFSEFQYVRATNTAAYLIAGSPVHPQTVCRFDFGTGKCTSLRKSADLEVNEGYLSKAEQIKFPTTHGKTAYAFFYAPRNSDFTAPNGELPPLIVKSHGGPTAATTSTFSLAVQYWTSRGFAVVDVNYGGSTGYGREYRNRLNKNWGVVDVDDCCNAAKYLGEKRLVDPKRLAISGGSAGGYTTLCALTFRKTFSAGASHYGISDLEALEVDTHKFESRYTHGLVGPYPAAKDLYKERSPIHHAEKLNCPVIFFQGLEDRVVPPNQSEMMVNALKRNGIPVAYVTFEGEQHGFRKAENIRRALDGELYFYSRIFKFDLPDQVESVKIENMESAASRR